LLNKKGSLHVFSGNRNNGMSVGEYNGGYSVNPVTFCEEGYSPFAGGVSAYGERVAWGGAITRPATAGTVLSVGYKDGRGPSNARHSIARSSGTGTTPVVAAVKYIQQASGIFPRVVLGWRDGDPAYGLDSRGSAYNSVFRTPVFTVGQRFALNKIRIPLHIAVSSTTTIAVVVYYDDAINSKTLTQINNTNYSGKKVVIYKNQDINSTGTCYTGDQNFFVEFTMSGSDGNSILLPLDFEAELLNE